MTTKEQIADLEQRIRDLAGRKSLSASDERRLTALRMQFTALDELRKEEERAELARLIDAGGLTIESGHTPERELDDHE